MALALPQLKALPLPIPLKALRLTDSPQLKALPKKNLIHRHSLMKNFKDLGYYSAMAYEGLIREARCELRIGERHFFQPRMCMLQWRHSGLVNYLNRTPDGLQVRVEGLWIG